MATDWSARIAETGATCSVGDNELRGIKSFRTEELTGHDPAFDEWPAGRAAYLDEIILCDKDVSKGQSLLLTARVDVGRRDSRR